MEKKIIQIVLEEWEGNDGKKRSDVIGLADDGLIYKWHRGSGTWVLYVLQSK